MKRPAYISILTAMLLGVGSPRAPLAASGVFRCQLPVISAGQTISCVTDQASLNANTPWSQCCTTPQGAVCPDTLECFRRAAPAGKTFSYQVSCFEASGQPQCVYTVTVGKSQ